MPEHAIRDRLETLDKDSDGKFIYQESAAFQQVKRVEQTSPLNLLKTLYKR